MKCLYVACVLVVYIGLSVAPPTGKEEKEVTDGMYNIDGLSQEEAREQEYYRYISQIVGELEKDENFKKMTENVTEDDIKSGKIADILDHVGHNVRKKVDETKRLEVEYQRDLIRRNKQHMADPDKAYWNPVHHGNQETFGKEDLKKLLRRHSDMIEEADKKRHEEFKKHELEKEHLRRESMKTMTADEKSAEEKKYEAAHHMPHETIHEPGHKAQMEEVWDKSYGYDPENFDPRTFFHINDKNADGHLDYYEVETFFLHDLDKLYNMSDPNVDLWQRDEELERMRMHMLKTMDQDGDGLVSLQEFLAETKDDKFVKDEEWKSLSEDQQFTDAEFAEYERRMLEVNEQNGDEDKKENH